TNQRIALFHPVLILISLVTPTFAIADNPIPADALASIFKPNTLNPAFASFLTSLPVLIVFVHSNPLPEVSNVQLKFPKPSEP
ncbi:hypothetical protein HK341_00775, partial [Streptococcus agalactiae]|nr:hypothetical protein [Streptococcus agalactiae]